MLKDKMNNNEARRAIHEEIILCHAWPTLQHLKSLEAHLTSYERDYLNELARQVIETNRLNNTGRAVAWADATIQAVAKRRAKQEAIQGTRTLTR